MIQTQCDQDTFFTFDNTLSPTKALFEPSFWASQNAIVNEKKGRATAYFVQMVDGQIAVLRHYWRGGLIGKLLSDQYLYLGLANTRVYKEFTLLCHLYEKGLPVPKPIAGYVSKAGLIYRGDILTAAIAGAESLNERLQQRPLTEAEWQRIASTLVRFHRAGVYHADLNINNILFDSKDDVHLIDFDRGELRTGAGSWSQQNMARLERSFYKEASRQNPFYWQAHEWNTLLSFYNTAMNE